MARERARACIIGLVICHLALIVFFEDLIAFQGNIKKIK